MRTELKHLRSASIEVHQNDDGTREQITHGGIRFYFNHDGRGDGELGWRKCDPAVLDVGDGLEIPYAPFAAKLPYTANGAFSFLNSMSDGTKHANITIASKADALPVTAVVQGTDIVYADAFGDGSDLVYQIQATGIARLIRVRAGHTPQANYTLRFDLPKGADVVRETATPYALDERGPKVVDKRAPTSIVSGVEAVYLRPFAAWSGGVSSVLSVTLEKVGDTLVITKTVPAWWDGTTDLWMDDTVSVTGSAIDGSVYHVPIKSNSQANWDSVHDAATGDGIDGSGATYLNICAYWRDSASDTMRFQRGFVNFTPALAVGDTVVSAKIGLYCSATSARSTNTDDIGIVAGTHANPLTTADFDAFANNTDLATRQSTITPSTQLEFPLNAAGLAALNKAAENKYCVRAGDDIDDTFPCYTSTSILADQFHSADNAANKPYLSITYTPAATVAPNSINLLGCGRA